MCLYPKIIQNPHYKPNKSNGGFVPVPSDERLLYIEIGCGVCYECRKKRANSWKTRLLEELKDNPTDKFVTLTFSDENLEKFDSDEPNEVCSKAIELFRKRWSATSKHKLKYWLIVELGHPSKYQWKKSTERVHMHGIMWTDETKENIEKIWKYGWVDFGEYVNERSINYIIKYATKTDKDHPNFIGKIFVSKGLGKGYLKRRPKQCVETYRSPQGRKLAMPIYYKDRFLTIEEKEKLRIEREDKCIKYINGMKIYVRNTEELIQYKRAVEEEQRRVIKLGYICKPWKKVKYKKKASPTDI